MIKKAYEEQRVKDMELWELQEEERVCNEKRIHRAEYKSIQTAQRLIKGLMDTGVHRKKSIQILNHSVSLCCRSAI